MTTITLKKNGNSYGFNIPSAILSELSFGPQDEFELLINNNCLTILKRRQHHSQWKFPNPDLSEEDEIWIEADLGENDE